jgi:Tol biopolymer transport system component
LPTFNIPVTWGNLNLTGMLVYTMSGQDGNTAYMRIQALDLASGAGTTIFQAPQNGFIYFATVSPDGKTLVMAYSPPPGANLSAHQELYSLPLDGSAPPQLLFIPVTNSDEYFQPEWSPDGKYLYFTHVNFQQAPSMPKQHYPIYEVYRMAYPGGQPEKLADQAYWPRLSGDSSHLAYVSLDPLEGKNNLFVANADGSNPQNVSLASQGIPDIVDAPIFTPDNQSILFSAVVPVQSSAPTWLEKVLGITVASAHTVPSDWWSIPLSGGTPKQLTHIQAVGLFGSISPDQQYIASYSGGGIFVMKPDGTESTMLIKDVGGQPGTVSWIP